MLINYLKVFFRSFWRSRFIAGINVLSLAVGLAGFIAIFFYVRHELQVDGFHGKAERIFRLTYDETAKIPNGRHLATTSPPMGPALVREYPEVEKTVRLRYTDDVVLRWEDRQFYEKGLVYADADFFELFDFVLAQGDASTALQAPNSIVLTPELAARYFGAADPMGQSLLLDGETSLTVSGVLAEQPKQSHLNFDGLISFTTFKVPYGYPVNLESWGWISFHTYLLLRQAEDAGALRAKLGDFMKEHLNPDRAARADLRLQALPDIYFHSGNLLNSQDNAGGNLIYLYGLSIIAILLILVAGFNYMNIATARSIKKGKEVGVRKILGAAPGTILRQFLTESVAIALISLLSGLVLFNFFQAPLFEAFAMETRPDGPDYLKAAPLFLLLTIGIGLLAGLYPAWLQSRFSSIDALKGKLKSGRSSLNVRKLLIISQFVMTSVLISGTLLVRNQMHFVQTKSLGFAKDEVLAVQMQTSDFLERYPKAHLLFSQNPYIRQISAGDPINDDYGSVPIVPEGFNREETSAMHLLGGYFDYFTTLGVNMLAGRDFSAAHPTDTNAIILNESAAMAFGWTPDEALGKQIEVNGSQTGPVIGVTEDFHFKSLHDPIQPLVTVVPRTRMEYFLLRINTADVPAAIASIQKDWQRIAPELPFDFSFVNAAVEARYRADERFFKLIGSFSILAISLACMGLYGLIATVVEYRVKEIGVRKVLGATVLQVSSILVRQFLVLLLLANVLAIPLTIWGGRQWLDTFTYRSGIGWSEFVISAALTVLLALISIGRQTWKAAVKNPVEALKDQ